MIFLEKETVDYISGMAETIPSITDLELPRLREQNPPYFTFFDYFSMHGNDWNAAFGAAVLTYLSFEKQLGLLRKRGQASIETLPRITDSVLASLEEGAANDDFWGRFVLQAIYNQNPLFLEFMTKYAIGTKDPVTVSRCFIFAYGLLRLQLEESKETHFRIPYSYLQ